MKIGGPQVIEAHPGSTVRLAAPVSDPDHNVVRVQWWQSNDAGTYPGDIVLSHPASLVTTFRVPEDARPGETIHVLIEATDDGTPPLTRYQRVIVTIQ
ncbi:MAG: hypothetical protein IRZ03_05420 [Acidobacterium ailaaui]|nr:hypothetical protein [Pseudacidobacterium ailaaui]